MILSFSESDGPGVHVTCRSRDPGIYVRPDLGQAHRDDSYRQLIMIIPVPICHCRHGTGVRIVHVMINDVVDVVDI